MKTGEIVTCFLSNQLFYKIILKILLRGIMAYILHVFKEMLGFH